MFISGVAVGQWNQICKKKKGKRKTIYRIARAYCLGDVTHVFKSRAYIVRYHDINLLVDHTGCVMTTWRDVSRPPVEVQENFKAVLSGLYTHKEMLDMADEIHKAIQQEVKAIETELRKTREEMLVHEH